MASLHANMSIKSPCYRELFDVSSKHGSRDQLQMRGFIRQVCQELVESQKLWRLGCAEGALGWIRGSQGPGREEERGEGGTGSQVCRGSGLRMNLQRQEEACGQWGDMTAEARRPRRAPWLHFQSQTLSLNLLGQEEGYTGRGHAFQLGKGWYVWCGGSEVCGVWCVV